MSSFPVWRSVLSSTLETAGVFIKRLFSAIRTSNLLPFSLVQLENNLRRLGNCYSQVIHHRKYEALICLAFLSCCPGWVFSCQCLYYVILSAVSVTWHSLEKIKLKSNIWNIGNKWCYLFIVMVTTGLKEKGLGTKTMNLWHQIELVRFRPKNKIMV